MSKKHFHPKKMKIASLEDDFAEAILIHQTLTKVGHECTTFVTGNALINALHSQIFDLVILDWHLPDMTGIDVIKWIRQNVGEDILVMFLSNHVLEENIVMGLMAGADDYMTKPIRVAELSARVHALSKRMRSMLNRSSSHHSLSKILEVGIYKFDFMQKIVTVAGKPVELKPKEFEVAALLFQNVGKLISREKIMQTVWGRELLMVSRTVDTHISRVRVRLQLNQNNRVRLTTVYTVGYRLDAF